MYRYSYFLPTNRPLLDNFREMCSEISYASRRYNIEIPFVISDDCRNDYNKQLIEEYKMRFGDIRFLYFDNYRIRLIYDAIKSQLPDRLHGIFSTLYPDGKINYGNTFNKLFILSILLGNDVLLRRDSDIFFQPYNNKNSEGKYLFPIDLEIKYLSNKVDNETVYVAGGGYKGKWGIDVDDFIKGSDYSMVRELMECLLIPYEYTDEIVEKEILNNSCEYKEDQVAFDAVAYPQCGNAGYYKLFYSLPCSPAPNIIATDYFLLETAIHKGLKVAYHNRAVIHRHTSDRVNSEEKFLDYWERVFLWIDMEVLYKKFFRKVQSMSGEGFDNDLLSSMVFCTMKECLLDKARDIREEQLLKFTGLLDRLEPKLYKKASKHLLNNKNSIFQHSEESMSAHLDLIGAWPEIVKTLCSIRNSPNIKGLLGL